MNKLVTVTAAFLALSTAVIYSPTAQAQAAPGARLHGRFRAAGTRGEGKRGELLKQLNLTADQKSKIKDIMQATRKKVVAVRQDTKLTPEDQKEKLKTIHKDSMKDISAVLTPEQRTKLKSLRHEAKAAK